MEIQITKLMLKTEPVSKRLSHNHDLFMRNFLILFLLCASVRANDLRLIGTNLYDFTYASQKSIYRINGQVTKIFPNSAEISFSILQSDPRDGHEFWGSAQIYLLNYPQRPYHRLFLGQEIDCVAIPTKDKGFYDYGIPFTGDFKQFQSNYVVLQNTIILTNSNSIFSNDYTPVDLAAKESAMSPEEKQTQFQLGQEAARREFVRFDYGIDPTDKMLRNYYRLTSMLGTNFDTVNTTNMTIYEKAETLENIKLLQQTIAGLRERAATVDRDIKQLQIDKQKEFFFGK
ncbi:MAG: hypothetical protein ABSC01_04445 [Verrucomicrobiota bacterium]|jgi:hypothetical protein